MRKRDKSIYSFAENKEEDGGKLDLKEEKWLIDFVIWNLSPQMVFAHA